MKRRFSAAALVGFLLGVALWMPASPLRAQVVNPADKQQEKPVPAQSGASGQDATRAHLRSWELPPIMVIGERPSKLREEDLVGAYQQPRWTARRRFGETRVYVISPGQFEFEYWLIPEFGRDNQTAVKKQYEVEMGLPQRIQLDLYVVSHQDGNMGGLKFDEEKFEVRWALADWGHIPLNPTLYLEWASEDSAADHVEGKLLLGGEIVPRLHWGANLVFEHEMGGPQENSKELTAGASYTVLD
jgi:hypothetical protein